MALIIDKEEVTSSSLAGSSKWQRSPYGGLCCFVGVRDWLVTSKPFFSKEGLEGL